MALVRDGRRIATNHGIVSYRLGTGNLTTPARLAGEQDLERRAREICARWWDAESDLPYALAALRLGECSQSLTFRNELLGYPSIRTSLRLYAGDREVGHYALITRLEGGVDDDFLVFDPQPARPPTVRSPASAG